MKIYPGIPLFWRVLPRRLDQGRVWGSADNFYKDLLVFGPWFPKGLVKIEVFVLSRKRGGSG